MQNVRIKLSLAAVLALAMPTLAEAASSAAQRVGAPAQARSEPARDIAAAALPQTSGRVDIALLDDSAQRQSHSAEPRRVRGHRHHYARRHKERALQFSEGAQSGLRSMIAREAGANGVPVALADAVVRIESRYNPRAAHGGAMGLMQIKPQTARGMGFSGSASALLTPETNLRYGMKYLGLAYRLSHGDTCQTVMRYQSGHYAARMSGANRVYCGKAKAIMANR
jgi:soluble lytic murein transglycosylase-like protein